MNAITPAKPIPPDQSTAASGTFPTEQTKLSTAISGPTITFSSVLGTTGASLDEEAVEEVVAEQADEAGEQEAERDLLPEHLPVAAEVVGHVGPGRGRASAARAATPAPRRRVGAGGPRPPAERARAPAPRLRRETNSRSTAHISAIITMPPTYSASVNCQPISTHSTRPELPDEVGRGELERQRGRRRGALLEQRLGDRDRRVRARRRGGAQPGGERDRPRPSPDSADSMRRRGTQACTIAEIRKPSTSAHQTCPRHQERVPDAVADLGDHIAHLNEAY